VARLKDTYFNEYRPQLKEELGVDSIMQVPEIKKITLNMGVGEAKNNSKLLDHATEQMAAIAGQRPVMTRARVSVATFKIRDGMPLGCKVTLRGERMYEFLDRLLSIALPRIRDFRGVSPAAFDKQGNYSLGIREQIIFPEVDYDEVDTVRGLDVVFTISGGSVEGSRALLKKFGMPFAKSAAAAKGSHF
jgi:large subunit ribosomal protein L5